MKSKICTGVEEADRCVSIKRLTVCVAVFLSAVLQA